MKLSKGKGLILNQKRMNEKDVVIEVLFQYQDRKEFDRKHFKVYGILKSYKRSPILIEPANYISINFYEKQNTEIWNIKEIDLIERFYHIKNNYENLYNLNKLLVLTKFATLSDSNLDPIYQLLLHALKYLDNFFLKPDSFITTILDQYKISFWDMILLFYSIRIFYIMGYVADLKQCPSCKRELKTKVKWQEGLYFYCSHCDPTANQIDFLYKEIMKIILEKKFRNFIESFDHLNRNYLQSSSHNTKSIEMYSIWEQFFQNFYIRISNLIPISIPIFS